MTPKTRKFLTRNAITHASAALAGYLMALIAIHIHGENKFNDRQDTAVYTIDRKLNRDIFSTDNFESIAWQYNSNQRIGETLGKTAAKEYAMDMDSVKSGTITAKKMYGKQSDYCTEAVVRAYRDATSRLGFRRANAQTAPFPIERCDTTNSFQRAMDNAKYIVEFFKTDSVPNSIITNPDDATIAKVSAGSIIRRGRHCYMYMGVGYIDQNGRTFVANSRGRPVVASDDKEQIFEYFNWSRCTVIDVPKIVEYKLQNDVQRHVR